MNDPCCGLITKLQDPPWNNLKLENYRIICLMKKYVHKKLKHVEMLNNKNKKYTLFPLK